MRSSRRQFLGQAAAVTGAFLALRTSVIARGWHRRRHPDFGYGDLRSDPNGLLDLPSGFEYRVFSKVGQTMDDGFRVPGAHDGMGAFPGPRGTTILVRNHELLASASELGAFGSDNALVERLPSGSLYDDGRGKHPGLGGTTTLVYDTHQRKLIRHFLSLAGTERNCAGGPTPWGSWITCEETVITPDDKHSRIHGFNFEVPATSQPRLARPVPLEAMGRFNHEAIAVDPKLGCVYQTEDQHESLLYRFLPEVRGKLQAGGRLQALALIDRPSCDTRNWSETTVAVGQEHRVHWIDLDDVLSPQEDLRYRGFAAGAARFARGEGLWQGQDGLYVSCTSGGPARRGQIWRYRADADGRGGSLELFVEPNDPGVLDHPDNLTAAPNGHLIVCEDGEKDQFLVGVTPEGKLYPFARNAMNSTEFAGAAFSPDGSTLFVNLQGLGLTLAITGPWKDS